MTYARNGSAAELGGEGGAEGLKQTNGADCANAADERNAFATLQARFATAGWEFTSVAGAGCTGPFLASRWGMARELDNMDQAGAFATAVGVHA